MPYPYLTAPSALAWPAECPYVPLLPAGSAVSRPGFLSVVLSTGRGERQAIVSRQLTHGPRYSKFLLSHGRLFGLDICTSFRQSTLPLFGYLPAF